MTDDVKVLETKKGIAVYINMAIAELDNTDIDIIKHLSNGLAYKEVAQKVGIHFRTIDNRVMKIRHKLGFANSAQLVSFAIRNKIIA